MIDLKEFIENSSHKKEMKKVVEISNLAFKNWKIYWTDFYSSFIYDDILQELSTLNDLQYFSYGGYSSAERKKIACVRSAIDSSEEDLIESFPCKGVDIKGDFLFDNATQNDFRNLLIENGLIKEEIGDLWTLGDRGAQGIISNCDIEFLENKLSAIRDVEVSIKIINLDELNKPLERSEKLINTVEASKRLDAIASAGFRVSRTKIIERINAGMLRLNGVVHKKSITNIKIGDRIYLENKGHIEILNLEMTKRERWKIKLLKK